MKHFFAKTEREDILLTFIDELYILKCEQYNDLSPADIEDGLAQMQNRVIALLKGTGNTA